MNSSSAFAFSSQALAVKRLADLPREGEPEWDNCGPVGNLIYCVSLFAGIFSTYALFLLALAFLEAP
jgi:hypothetical protein